MDLRKQKTRKAIQQTFMQLRVTKDLEQITVKELSDLAQISKATFYLHYRDIYDLSEHLQQDAIQNVFAHIKSPLSVLDNLSQFIQELTYAIEKENAIVSTLFSGSQAAALPISLEVQIKKYIFEQYPNLKNDARINVQLSYHIQGGYFAYMENMRELGSGQALSIIADIQKELPAIKPE